MNKKAIFIIKIGGNVIDDEILLDKFLFDFSNLPSPKILIHGGGKLATSLASQLNVEQNIIEGRRITCSETLKITTMVFAGWINKMIVARLNSIGCKAIGLSGVDLNLIPAKKRNSENIDYGFAGDPLSDEIQDEKISSLLSLCGCLVFAPVTSDKRGQLLNTNADTIASVLAKKLTGRYNVKLVYCFEKSGVLNDNKFLESITRDQFTQLKSSGVIHSGMLPKLEMAFEAMENGVENVALGHSSELSGLVKFNYENGTILAQ